MKSSTRGKITDAAATNGTDNQSGSLRHEASMLLLSPQSTSMIQSTRGSTGSGMDRDQVAQMLALNPCPDLLDEMVKHDKRAAMDFVKQNTELQTHGLHNVEDEAFRQELRLQLTGNPAMAV